MLIYDTDPGIDFKGRGRAEAVEGSGAKGAKNR